MKYTFCEFYSKVTEGLDPQRIGEELEQLRIACDGIFTTEQVVKFAKDNQTTECYKVFQWNNRKAAKQFRKQQVTNLVASLRVVKRRKPVKPFIHPPGTRGYCSFDEVMADEELREKYQDKLYKRLERFQAETVAMEEFTGVNREIEKARIRRKLKVKKTKQAA